MNNHAINRRSQLAACCLLAAITVSAGVCRPAQAAVASQMAAADTWCNASQVSEAVIKSLQDDAQRRRSDQSRAVSRLHTEGTLPHQGIWDQSVGAAKDLPRMRSLALIWRASQNAQALNELDGLLASWAAVYQPSLNPIDETGFDAMIDAFAIAKADLQPATRKRVTQFLQHWASAYLKQMEHPPKPARGIWTNNWQSHRIKLLTMMAAALGDEPMFEAAGRQFRQQLNQNLHADGRSIDFDERDALHYVVYDLEPLTRAALAAQTRQQDWLNMEADNGASLKKAINWLLPFASGVQSHQEFANTSVKFDLQRRAAGLPGYSGSWDARSSGQLFWLASKLDDRYLAQASDLIKQTPWIAACWK